MDMSIAGDIAVDDVDVFATVRIREETRYEMVAQEATAACYEDCAENGGW